MKKKATKKLVLAKETVRSLQDGALGQVAGGSDYGFDCSADTYYNSCRIYCLPEPIGNPG